MSRKAIGNWIGGFVLLAAAEIVYVFNFGLQFPPREEPNSVATQQIARGTNAPASERQMAAGVANIAPRIPSAQTAPQEQAPPLRLLGVMQMGDYKRALIRLAADPNGKWLDIGEDLAGWQLRELDHHSAVVELKGRRFRLQLLDAPLASR